MDKKALLAIGLSLAIWLGWQKFYIEPYQKKAVAEQRILEAARQASLKKEAPKATEATSAVSAGYGSKLEAKQPSGLAQEIETIREKDFSLGLSNGPSLLHDWVLRGYSKTIQNKADTISLEYVTGYADQLKLRFADGKYDDLNESVWSSFHKEKSGAGATLSSPKVSVERNFTAQANNFYGDLVYRFHFSEAPPQFVFLDIMGSPKRPQDKEGSFLGQIPDKVRFTFRTGDDRKTIVASSLKEAFESSAGVKWVGVDSRYFVFAVTPGKEFRGNTGLQVQKDFYKGVEYVRGSLVIPTEGRKDFSLPLKVYFGPKHLENLEAADPILSDAIDFGWTTPIAIPLLKALQWFYTYLKNYGIAIIVLTVMIKILLFPLTYKSMTSMAKMAKLQPQLNALREKYKEDKERLNTEMLNFMKVNGYNPVGGCLPTILQMPIFFSLYRVFFNSMELYQAPFFGWIHDLSASDPLFVTPVLLAGLMFLQQKLSPSTATDPAQQKMMQIMPLLFGAFMLFLPAGLNIYMVVNSLTSIVQQHLLNKKFGLRRGIQTTVTRA